MSRQRLPAVAGIAALWVLTAVVCVVLLTWPRPSQDSEVLGERFTSPTEESLPGGPPSPQQATTAATIGADGTISLAQTLVWSDTVPPVIGVSQPVLGGIEALLDDVSPVIGRPEATLDGRPLQVEPGDNGAWRVLAPGGQGAGTVALTYQVQDALHRDPQSPPGRALAVIPLPPLDIPADAPRQVSLPSAGVLNVSCPLAAGEAVLLCATLQGDTWLVSVPPGGHVVLAQLDLPAL